MLKWSNELKCRVGEMMRMASLACEALDDAMVRRQEAETDCQLFAPLFNPPDQPDFSYAALDQLRVYEIPRMSALADGAASAERRRVRSVLRRPVRCHVQDARNGLDSSGHRGHDKEHADRVSASLRSAA
jgi:hypothetical protein